MPGAACGSGRGLGGRRWGRISMARSMPASSRSRWVTSRTVRGPSTDTSTPSARAAAASAGASSRRLGQVQRDDVRAHRPRPTTPNGASASASRAGPGVVVGEPVDVVVQRVQAGGGEDAGLPHAAAHPLADDPGPRRCCSALPTTSEPTGAPRPLDRQTDRVSKSAPYVGSGTPVGDVRVPDPGAVAVQGEAGVVGDLAQRPQGRQRDDRRRRRGCGSARRRSPGSAPRSSRPAGSCRPPGPGRCPRRPPARCAWRCRRYAAAAPIS